MGGASMWWYTVVGGKENEIRVKVARCHAEVPYCTGVICAEEFPCIPCDMGVGCGGTTRGKIHLGWSEGFGAGRFLEVHAFYST